ncbi:hypothetical protein [Mucilaginibacter antarcticus]|uniref:Pentapeptide repeat protein n=1 Tax=Mucilaginibacter antarcticus TaxID=1855725 RepID=A0ABW5XNV0_9SPHI
MKKFIIATAIILTAGITSTFAAEKNNLGTADRIEKNNLGTADKAGEKNNLGTADRAGEKNNLGTADRF